MGRMIEFLDLDELEGLARGLTFCGDDKNIISVINLLLQLLKSWRQLQGMIERKYTIQLTLFIMAV